MEFDEVKSEKQAMEISVYDKDTFSDDYIGEVTVPLAELKNQQKVDKWLNLVDKEQKQIGKIHVTMQWVWSKAAQIKEQMKPQEAEVQRLEGEIQNKRHSYEEAVKARQE